MQGIFVPSKDMFAFIISDNAYLVDNGTATIDT